MRKKMTSPTPIDKEESANAETDSIPRTTLSDLFFEGTSQVVYSPTALTATIRAHTRIADAIRNADPDAARVAMTRHVTGFDEYMQRTSRIRSC